jgi:hypothetical protein
MKTLLNKQTEPSEQTLKTIAHMPTKSLPVLMGDEFSQGLTDVDFMRVAVLLAQKSYEERKTGTDLFSGSRPPRFPHFNPDIYTTLDRVDELLAARQLIAVDSRCNQFVRFGATFTFNETPVGVGIYRDFVTPFPKRTTAFFKGVHEASLAAGQTFHGLSI